MGSADYKFLYDDIYKVNPTVKNRFEGYTPEFDYNSMSGVLDKLNNLQRDKGMKAFGGLLDKNKRSARASAASSGLPGGSAIMRDLMAEAEDRVGGQTSDFLSNLDANRLGMDVGLMRDANANKFRTTQAATNVDQGNVSSTLQRGGLINSILAGKQGAEQYEDQKPTWLDDAFGFITDAASVALPFVLPGVGSVASAGIQGLKAMGGQQQPMSYNTRKPLSTVPVPNYPNVG